VDFVEFHMTVHFLHNMADFIENVMTVKYEVLN